MDAWIWIALAVIIVIGAAIAAFTVWQENQRRASTQLKDQFGPVYDDTVSSLGSKREAEKELKHRVERVERLRLRPLSGDERTELEKEWVTIQSSFIDDPAAAAADADDLVDSALTRRGYPPSDFERRLDDLSVDHPEVVRRYRTARMTARRDEADTEALRKAVVEYRSVLAELANADVEVPAIVRSEDLARAS